MNRLESAISGVLSLVPLICVAIVTIWPQWNQRRWAEQFEREYGYDPLDPSLSWRDVPLVEEHGVYLEGLVVYGYVGLLGLAISLALIIYFSRKALRNSKLAKKVKRAWVAALVIANAIAFPVAWYVFVWKERDVEESTSSGGDRD